MATEKITMPQLGESVTEGTISTWLVQAGDHIEKYDPIAEVMTDKVNAEIPSSYTGTIKELVAEEGETIAVGELICYMDIESSGEKETETPAPEIEGKDTSEKAEETAGDQSMKRRYSPAVLRMAQDNDLDLEQIEGTGKGGRITRKDVEKHLASVKDTTEAVSDHAPETSGVRSETTPTYQADQEPREQTTTGEGDIEIPVKGVRKVIADNMVKSTTEIPHAWMTVEVDVTDLVHYRNAHKDEFRQTEGFNLTFFAFFVKAVAQALKKYPQLNSMWAEDKIIQKKDVNLSIAVAKNNELFVPVIHHADEKSLKGIAKNIHDLAQKARAGKLAPEDMQGGTFTVNNTGSFGSISSMGVINHPQAAILQVESIVKRPVIINDMFAARDMVNLSLSLDHRILDGLISGKFLQHVKESLENVNESNTSIY